MSKSIEELAKQFTDELFAGDDLTDFDTQTAKDDAYVMCMTFGNHLMSLPLSQRLTDEERERVRKDYMQAIKDWIGVGDARSYSRTCVALESIFGKELFGEDEV
jgi:hypothetical protein